ncbi:MAG: hypothetical protein ACFCU1_08650 [Sumerlaeia bacterium]
MSFCNSFALGCAVAIPAAVLLTLISSPKVLNVPPKTLFWCWGVLGFLSLLFIYPQRRTFLGNMRTGWSKASVCLVLLAFVPILLSTAILIRPQFNYDLLSYHLPISHEIALGKGLGLSEYDYYRNLPLSPMLLYIPALSDPAGSVGDSGVGVILWVAWLFTALSVGRLVAILGGRRTEQALGFLLVCYSTMFVGAFLNSNSDLLTAVVVVAGLGETLRGLSLHRSLNEKQHSLKILQLFIGGLLLGSAYGFKQSALAVVLIPIILTVLIWFFAARVKPNRAGLIASALFIGIIFSVGPWALRSWHFAGNPLFPLAGEAEVWSNKQQEFLQQEHQIVSPLSSEHFQELIKNLGIWEFPLVTYHYNPASDEFTATTYLPALIYPLIMTWFFAGRKKRLSHAVIISVCALGFGAWCLVGEAPARFMAPLVALIFAFTAVLIGRAHPVVARRGIWILAGGIIFLNAWRLVSSDHTGQPGKVRLGWYQEIWSSDLVFPDKLLQLQHQQAGKTWLIFENRERLFNGPTITNKVWNPIPYFYHNEINSVQQLIRVLSADGITTVVVNDEELRRLVQFYGEDKSIIRDVGIRSAEDDYALLIQNYPPTVFAEMSSAEIAVFVEFLRLCRFQALGTVQTGPSSEIWISPLPRIESTSSPL